MKNIILLLIGLAIGFASCYFFMKPSTNKFTEDQKGLLPNEEEVNALNQFAETLQNKVNLLAEYDSTNGEFIKTADVLKRRKDFKKWAVTNRIVSNVLIPNSYFVGKDHLKGLLQNMKNENSNSKGDKKIAGIIISLTLIDDEITYTDRSGNEVTHKGKRVDPILIPVRVNKNPHHVEPKNNLVTDPGTNLDKSLPCPDNC